MSSTRDRSGSDLHRNPSPATNNQGEPPAYSYQPPQSSSHNHSHNQAPYSPVSAAPFRQRTFTNEQNQQFGVYNQTFRNGQGIPPPPPMGPQTPVMSLPPPPPLPMGRGQNPQLGVLIPPPPSANPSSAISSSHPFWSRQPFVPAPVSKSRTIQSYNPSAYSTYPNQSTYNNMLSQPVGNSLAMSATYVPDSTSSGWGPGVGIPPPDDFHYDAHYDGSGTVNSSTTMSLHTPIEASTINSFSAHPSNSTYMSSNQTYSTQPSHATMAANAFSSIGHSSQSQQNTVDTNDAAYLWGEEKVLSWLAHKGFTQDWIDAFKESELYGENFLNIGRERLFLPVQHNLIYPFLQNRQGSKYDKAKEAAQAKKLRVLVKQIVDNNNKDPNPSYSSQHRREGSEGADNSPALTAAYTPSSGTGDRSPGFWPEGRENSSSARTTSDNLPLPETGRGNRADQDTHLSPQPSPRLQPTNTQWGKHRRAPSSDSTSNRKPVPDRSPNEAQTQAQIHNQNQSQPQSQAQAQPHTQSSSFKESRNFFDKFRRKDRTNPAATDESENSPTSPANVRAPLSNIFKHTKNASDTSLNRTTAGVSVGKVSSPLPTEDESRKVAFVTEDGKNWKLIDFSKVESAVRIRRTIAHALQVTSTNEFKLHLTSPLQTDHYEALSDELLIQALHNVVDAHGSLKLWAHFSNGDRDTEKRLTTNGKPLPSSIIAILKGEDTEIESKRNHNRLRLHKLQAETLDPNQKSPGITGRSVDFDNRRQSPFEPKPPFDPNRKSREYKPTRPPPAAPGDSKMLRKADSLSRKSARLSQDPDQRNGAPETIYENGTSTNSPGRNSARGRRSPGSDGSDKITSASVRPNLTLQMPVTASSSTRIKQLDAEKLRQTTQNKKVEIPARKIPSIFDASSAEEEDDEDGDDDDDDDDDINNNNDDDSDSDDSLFAVAINRPGDKQKQKQKAVGPQKRSKNTKPLSVRTRSVQFSTNPEIKSASTDRHSMSSISMASPASNHGLDEEDRKNRRRSFASDIWAARPSAEGIVDNLDAFFPDLNLDQPVIPEPIPGWEPLGADDDGKLYEPNDTLGSDESTLKQRNTKYNLPPLTMAPLQNHRQSVGLSRAKSIREVVQQTYYGNGTLSSTPNNSRGVKQPQPAHPPLPNRVSTIRQAAKGSVERRKSTKMFGSKIQQVTPNRQSRLIDHPEGIFEDYQMSATSGPSNMPAVAEGPQTMTWIKGQLIGKGTFGRVYVGMNLATGELIAVKQVEVNPKATGIEREKLREMVKSLENEIETMEPLEHPYIVSYLGAERKEMAISIFLEYISGGSIGSVLRKHGKFEECVVSSLTRQVLDGLAYLHNEGILHRDLKADNILLDGNGIAKISDFGISKKTDNIYGNDSSNGMQGSVFWMAPEVIRSKGLGYSAKVDVWSLGCVVLEMFCGRRPWTGEEMIGAIYKLGELNQPPPIPEDVAMTISPSALGFMFDCFSIDPLERPTAGALKNHVFCAIDPNYRFFDTEIGRNIKPTQINAII